MAWFVAADGTIISSTTGADLPAAYTAVTAPQTVTIGATEFRITGGPARSGYVVVGQSLESVAEAQGTYVLAALIIGPLLLLVVFLGAVVIGRRVAAPIERARQRQLEFTADASHELRTPVSVIEANTSLALSQDRSADWYRAAFGRVSLETRRMARLLDDLLWLARFDVTAGAPDSEPVDVGVLATQTMDRFGIVAEARHLTLSVRAEPGSLVVSAPPAWLDRLVGVLLDNACKYAPENGEVTVAVAGDGGRVRLTVDDSGPGIPTEQRARIFDRFHRATDRESGAGLGLAIGDAIVRATGGRWRIGASPTGGASMSVSWRRVIAAGQATWSPTSKVEP